MIIFIDEERAYLYWVTHHRHGFVLDGRRWPKPGHFALHRATCSETKQRSSKSSHWTTGGRFKACAVTLEELQQWAVQQEQVPALCDVCRPREQVDDISSSSLSKLAGDVLDYVIEAALIHFEHEHPRYQLCVGDIAACFAKTPGQLSASFRQLIGHELITVRGRSPHPDLLDIKSTVYPTLAGLRTQPSLANESDAALRDQLAKL